MAEAVRASQPLALLTLIDSSGDANHHPMRALLRPNTEATGLPAEIPALAVRQLAEIVSTAAPALLEIDPQGAMRPTTHLSDKTRQVFVDPLPGAHRLIIIGAGHVGQALADLGAMLGFHIVVIDDRAAFANRERFPGAAEIIVETLRSGPRFSKARQHLLRRVRHSGPFVRRERFAGGAAPETPLPQG